MTVVTEFEIACAAVLTIIVLAIVAGCWWCQVLDEVDAYETDEML